MSSQTSEPVARVGLDGLSPHPEVKTRHDEAVDAEDIAAATRAAEVQLGAGHAGITGRWMGRSLLLEVVGALPSTTSLEEADAVGRRVEAAVLDAVPAARRVRWQARSG